MIQIIKEINPIIIDKIYQTIITKDNLNLNIIKIKIIIHRI